MQPRPSPMSKTSISTAAPSATATLEDAIETSTSTPILQVQGLTKTFRVGDVDVHALRGLDLEVARGEFIAVIGSSGSGKSTLFNILGGLTPPTSGSVRLDDRDLAAMSDTERTQLRKQTVGFVFQKYN